MTENDRITQIANDALGTPPADEVAESRRRVRGWFEETAPLIVWDAVPSPLGKLYVAATEAGLCAVAFRTTEADFLARLDPLARVERRPDTLAAAVEQLRAYFDTPSRGFDLPLDLSAVTDFQRAALKLVSRIPAGTVWTYGQVAAALGRPRASRAVGQAMAHNPVPIVVPCHRVVGSSGALTGYGGGGGLATKQWLLEFEGAL